MLKMPGSFQRNKTIKGTWHCNIYPTRSYMLASHNFIHITKVCEYAYDNAKTFVDELETHSRAVNIPTRPISQTIDNTWIC